MFNVTVRQSRTLFDLNSFREIKNPPSTMSSYISKQDV